MIASLVLTAMATIAPASSPTTISGTYVVEGGCTGGAPYNGVITVEQNGDAYALTWKIAQDTYTGNALDSDGVLAISFMAGDQSGAMYMRRDNTGWGGKWAMLHSRTACTEHWTPRG